MEDKLDYSETSWKMDKFMPEESEIQNEYYEILEQQGGDKQSQLEDFFETHADEDRLKNYLPKDGTIAGFCEYLISNHKS